MRIIKITAVMLLTVFAVCSFCSCDRIKNIIRPEDPDRIVSYINDDYHFTLRHPAYFSKTEVKESEENGDEINIKLIASEDDLIDIDIRYKNENGDSSSTLYDYIIANGLDKKKIQPTSTNSFAYDDRDGTDPAYYIYAATKRMIYVISYAHNPENEKEQFVIDSLAFEFEIYANLPKENAFLSSPYKLAIGYLSVQALADADVTFDTDPTYNADGTANYYFCRRMTAEAERYKAVFACPLIARYQYLDFADTDLNAEAAAITEDLCPGLENAVFGTASEKRNGNIWYKIIPFECDYNGEHSTGSLTIGYSILTYFEYVNVINDTSTDAEMQNFNDMLASIKV